MAAWPGSVTQYPLVGTLSISPEPNIAEFKPDVGSPVRRKRYAGKRFVLTADMQLVGSQMQTIMDFFDDDCADGAITFTMTDWQLGTSQTFEWLSPPAFQHIARDVWRVSLQIARLPS